MTLKGDLGTVGLTTILQLLESDSKTGLLQIKSKEKIAGLFVKDGSIAYATCSQSNSRLGYLLRSSGVITDEQLETHLALSKETNQALGKILVDENVITNQTLSEFIQKQAENIIYDLFFWKAGDYEYQDMDINPERILIKKINVMHVLLEASRRIDEMQIMKEQIPDDNLIFEKSGNIKSVEDELNEDEFAVLALINGNDSVRQVIEKSGFDEYSVYNMLNSLILSGCIHPYEERASQETVEEEGALEEDLKLEMLQDETDIVESEGTTPENHDQPGYTEDEVPAEDVKAEASQESAKVISDEEKSLSLEPGEKKPDSFLSKIIAPFNGERRLKVIGASIICMLIIVVASILGPKYIKAKRMESAYRRVLMQVDNTSELEKREKLLLGFLNSNKENIHSRDVKKKLDEIRNNMKERNFKLAISKADAFSKNENDVEARNVYLQYLAQKPKTVYADEIQKKLAKVNSLLDVEEYGKLKDIAQKDYVARVLAYDRYLKNHPEGKYIKKVMALNSSAIEGYCTYLKDETGAGKNISINSIIFENHKDQILLLSTDLMLPDDKLQVKELLMKGNKELKISHYEEAIKAYNQSLAIVRNSQLAEFPAYKSFESNILSTLNDDNLKYFKKGFFQFKGKWYSLQEYEKTIQKHGYVKDKGAWYSPEEYKSLMISRGFYKFEEKYLTQNSFINKVLVPVLRKKCKLEDWQKIDSIDIKLKGSNDDEMVYKVRGVATAHLEDYKVIIDMSIDATFHKKNNHWRFHNLQKDSFLERYE